MSDTLLTLNLDQWTNAVNAVNALVNAPHTSGVEKIVQHGQTSKSTVASKVLPKLQPAPFTHLSQTMPVSAVPVTTIRSVPASALSLPLMLSLNLQNKPAPERMILPAFPLSLPVMSSDSVRPSMAQTVPQVQEADSMSLNLAPLTAVDVQSLQSSLPSQNYINLTSNPSTEADTIQMSLPSNGPIISPVTFSSPVLNAVSKDDSSSIGILSNQDCAQIQNTLSTLLSVSSANHNHPSDIISTSHPIVHAVSLPIADSNQNKDGRIDRQKELQSCIGNAPDSAAMALANMSMMDMLLKSQQSDLSSDCSLDQTDVSNKPLVDHDTSGIPVLNGPFCIECNSVSVDDCLNHNNLYMEVLDTPILSQARASVPHCLQIKESSVNAGSVTQTLGVWTQENVPARTKFGPLIGSVSTPLVKDRNINEQNFPGWQIFYMDRYDVIDVEDENNANWMRFVQFSRNRSSQNLVAHQFGTEIYFITTRDMCIDEEMFVWYSKDYARLLGVPSTPGMKKLLSCSMCGKNFYGMKSLARHIRQDHPKDSNGKFKCQLCMREFLSAKKLHMHTLVHMGMKPFHCVQCNKQFTDQSNLRTHLAIHSGIKRFVCSVCHKTFRQKAHLQSHMLTHTGERNEECPYCNKMFARTSDLKQHIYQHTKERTFTCPECSKVFYKLQNYKNHMLIHSGERNHMCSKCNKMFYKKYHLQRHFKSCKGVKTEIYLNKHNKAMNIVGMEEVELGASLALEEPQQVLGGKSCDKNHQLNAFSQDGRGANVNSTCDNS